VKLRPYVGRLDDGSEIYRYIVTELSSIFSEPIFHVTQLGKKVLKYADEKTGISVVGKLLHLEADSKEFENLKKLESLGLCEGHYRVIRPLGSRKEISLSLLSPFVPGEDLDYYLEAALLEGGSLLLKEKLQNLSALLIRLHGIENEGPYFYEFERSYVRKIVLKLQKDGILSLDEGRYFLKLFDLWIESFLRFKRKKAILHGDVTPTNFIFPGEGEIVAIDLERMRMGDPIYDLGFVCAEIKHAFLWRRGDWFSSEPYIRAFLEFYCEKKEDSQRSFEEITRDLPFFMAICELRIARNEYLESSYRRRLCEEARKCLFSGLSVLF